ncbi:MAG: DUF2336 domain-containing protein, partial [Hyphomicrobiales bacterium]|nr:DUF2336 domain-containing protein [Hyphomicrobiales bacterium]
MSSLEIVLAELETAIENADAARRNGLLRRFTDQLTEQVDVLDEEKIEVYDEVIFNLAHDIEFHARIELAEALADLERGPLRTIRDLAFDDRIAVAAPVIRRSPRLSEEDTLQIAREKGQDHLLVLSERRNLSEAVTDVIVDRGHYPVHRCLARNETARFSGQAMEKLAHSADDDRVLA